MKAAHANAAARARMAGARAAHARAAHARMMGREKRAVRAVDAKAEALAAHAKEADRATHAREAAHAAGAAADRDGHARGARYAAAVLRMGRTGTRSAASRNAADTTNADARWWWSARPDAGAGCRGRAAAAGRKNTGIP